MMRRLIVCFALIAVASNAEQAWDFSGPSQTIGWPQDYPSCQSTNNPAQSPVDFAQVPVDFGLRPLPGDWVSTTQFTVSSVSQVSLSIYPKVGVPAIAHPTTRRFYLLKEAKVYTPSIHTFGGAHRDLEIALLHELEPDQVTSNSVAPAATKYLSVSLTFTAAPLRVDNTFIESIFGVDGSLPTGGTFFTAMNTTINRTVSWASAAPLSRDYLHYKGSLPTPPCSSEVEHYVHTNANRMSYAQLADIRRILGFSQLPTGQVTGFAESDPAATSTSFDVDGNVRTTPSPMENTKQHLVVKGQNAMTRFMDFVGDDILLMEPKHTTFMDSLELNYQVVYALGVVSFVLSLVALRIGVS